MVKIGAITTSEGTHLLQLTQRSPGQTEIIKGNRKPERLQEG
tara:strand:+ start:217 stop:342 length:126 start_codon:yes stop_codon:yes gene_type:complete